VENPVKTKYSPWTSVQKDSNFVPEEVTPSKPDTQVLLDLLSAIESGKESLVAEGVGSKGIQEFELAVMKGVDPQQALSNILLKYSKPVESFIPAGE
jgi:hypothetical protein